MSWFKIDDNFHVHPKVKSIPRKDRAAAVGLWCMAGSWCSQQLTDGHVPSYMLEEFGASPRLATVLVAARLWVVETERGGWIFHDWHSHQPSKAEVDEKRRKSAERLKAWRAGKMASSNASETTLHEHSYNVSPEFGNASETLTPTRPDPTRPDPTVLPTEVLKNSSSRTRHEYPDDFEEFWSIYPRLEGKDVSLRAWRAALKRADMADIMAGVKRYIDAKRGEPKKFLKTPAAWLNGGHWMDQHEDAETALTFGGGRPSWEQ